VRDDLAFIRAFARAVSSRERLAASTTCVLSVAAGAVGVSAWGLCGGGVWEALTGLAGAALACIGAARLALLLLHPPDASEAASWVEEARPELRDSLSTALEEGPFAAASARYAARRLEGLRPREFPPPDRRRGRLGRLRRPVLLAASALVFGSGAVILVTGRPGRRPEGVPAKAMSPVVDSAPPAEGVQVLPAEERSARRMRGPGRPSPESPAADPSAGARAGGRIRILVRPSPADLGRAGEGAQLSAEEILLNAPSGYERAVEEFLATGGGRGD
jgi:hypothetical protein